MLLFLNARRTNNKIIKCHQILCICHMCITSCCLIVLQAGFIESPSVLECLFCVFYWTEKETNLGPFILRKLLPSSLGGYYRYTGSLTTPPCSKVVEWIIFSRPVYLSYHQVGKHTHTHMIMPTCTSHSYDHVSPPAVCTMLEIGLRSFSCIIFVPSASKHTNTNRQYYTSSVTHLLCAQMFLEMRRCRRFTKQIDACICIYVL